MSQMNLARNLDWALFEVIDNGALGEHRCSLVTRQFTLSKEPNFLF